MAKKLDSCVNKVQKGGKTESQAYAICNASMKKKSTKKKK